MGLLYTCDCGKKKVVDDINELKPMGVMGKLYCIGECADKMDAFLKERDELHDKVSKLWQTGLDRLKKKYHDQGCGCLPDEVEPPKQDADGNTD